MNHLPSINSLLRLHNIYTTVALEKGFHCVACFPLGTNIRIYNTLTPASTSGLERYQNLTVTPRPLNYSIHTLLWHSTTSKGHRKWMKTHTKLQWLTTKPYPLLLSGYHISLSLSLSRSPSPCLFSLPSPLPEFKFKQVNHFKKKKIILQLYFDRLVKRKRRTDSIHHKGYDWH